MFEPSIIALTGNFKKLTGLVTAVDQLNRGFTHDLLKVFKAPKKNCSTKEFVEAFNEMYPKYKIKEVEIDLTVSTVG